MKFISLILSVSFLLFACQSDGSKSIQQTSSTSENTYTNTTLGWHIDIPKNWRIISEEQFNNQNQEGKKALEGIMEGSLTATGLQQLISFQKDQFNVFQSTAEAVKGAQEWAANHKDMQEMMIDAFRSQGIHAEASATRNEKISGLDFQVFEITIFDMNKEILVQQLSYSRFLKGYDVSIIINYNNPDDKATLLKALTNSRFER